MVTITSIIYALDVRAPNKQRTVIGRLGYTVRSEHGGELTTTPEDLRPGNILDRISVALEDEPQLRTTE